MHSQRPENNPSKTADPAKTGAWEEWDIRLKNLIEGTVNKEAQPESTPAPLEEEPSDERDYTRVLERKFTTQTGHQFTVSVNTGDSYARIEWALDEPGHLQSHQSKIVLKFVDNSSSKAPEARIDTIVSALLQADSKFGKKPGFTALSSIAGRQLLKHSIIEKFTATNFSGFNNQGIPPLILAPNAEIDVTGDTLMLCLVANSQVHINRLNLKNSYLFLHCPEARINYLDTDSKTLIAGTINRSKINFRARCHADCSLLDVSEVVVDAGGQNNTDLSSVFISEEGKSGRPFHSELINRGLGKLVGMIRGPHRAPDDSLEVFDRFIELLSGTLQTEQAELNFNTIFSKERLFFNIDGKTVGVSPLEGGRCELVFFNSGSQVKFEYSLPQAFKALMERVPRHKIMEIINQ